MTKCDWKFAGLLLGVAGALVGCDQPQFRDPETAGATGASQPRSESESSAEINAIAPIGLYSTLAGKMARMEELLNAIDRFLDSPELKDRVVSDTREFHRLLRESRGRYPAGLSNRDQPQFDEAIERTLITASALLMAVQRDDRQSARQALHQLAKQRQDSHAQFVN